MASFFFFFPWLGSFLFFNYHGLKQNGFNYVKHFAGPIWWLSWFIFPLELLSMCIRPVSLTVRLYANMLAGEQVTLGFMALIRLIPLTEAVDMVLAGQITNGPAIAGLLAAAHARDRGWAPLRPVDSPPPG